MQELPPSLRERLGPLNSTPQLPHLREESAAADADDTENLVLGYFSCPQDSSKAYLGALLITDGRTRPLHFGWVQPVRPTSMQKILYGPTLDEHVRVDVIAKKLTAEGVGYVPNLILVDSPSLLRAKRVFGVPLAHLSRSQHSPQEVSVSMYRYETSESHDGAEISQFITSLEQVVDLLEPFNRIQEALKEALRGDRK